MTPNMHAGTLIAGFLMMGLAMAVIGAWIGLIIRLALGYSILPAWTPRLVPWGAGSVLVTMVVWFLVLMSVPALASVATRAMGEKSKPRIEMSPSQIMSLSALQNVATLLVVPLALAATSGARLRDFGISRDRFFRRVGHGALAYPTLVPVVFGVMIASVLYWGKTPHPLEDAIAQDKTPGMAIIFVLAGVVLAPMAEEMIFRGVLLGWLTKLAFQGNQAAKPDPFAELDHDFDKFDPPAPLELVSPEPAPDFGLPTGDSGVYDPYAPPTALIVAIPETATATDLTSPRLFPLLMANVAVSLIFAGLHGAVWPTPVPIFFLSLVLGLLYQRTGSLVGPITLHMIFNGMSTLLMFLTLGSGVNKAPQAPNPIPAPAHATVDVPKIFELQRIH